jgi:hypothetical protein
LPASLAELVHYFLGTSVLHLERRVVPKQSLKKTFARMKKPLDPERTIFVEFGTTIYAPVAYIPAAIAIAAGRSIGAGPLGLLSEDCKRLAALLVTWVALRAMPAGRTRVGNCAVP